MNVEERRFTFKEIRLLKESSLGIGSYGSVCKAKCDNLTCAAKILHPILFDLSDPGVQTMLRRFEQECRLLSSISHPNIVQYLGTHIDPDTRLPVLLMELMDESLTHFLETPLSFQTRVNFSHDIALALTYLHSNTIIHRDLSSNNILLIAERRAKVTDFGMSQLERVNPRITPATICPGTLVYMPPEALKERPHHTDKLDVFSFGVLILQILTRKFPSPTDRFKQLLVPNPEDKNTTIEVQAPVKEIERRKNHISLVDSEDPLLKLSLECLTDSYEDRPSADTLCTQIEALRSLEDTDVSYKVKYLKLKQEFDQQEQHLHQLSANSVQKEAYTEEMAKKQIEVDNKHQDEIEMYKRLLKDKDYIIAEKDRIIKAQEDKLTMSAGFSLRWRRSRNTPVRFTEGGHSAVAENIAYFKRFDSPEIYQFDTEKELWQTLTKPPLTFGFTITAIHDLLLTTVGGSSNPRGKLYTYMGKHADKKWVERFPPLGLKCIHPSVTCTKKSMIVFGLNEAPVQNFIGCVLDLVTLQWSRFQPQFTNQYHHSASVFVLDQTLYFAGGIDKFGSTMYFYTCLLSQITQPNAWKSRSMLMQYHQTVTHFGGNILGIGGSSNHLYTQGDKNKTNTIYKYDPSTNKWSEFGEMEVHRSDCLVAVMNNKMIVIGNEIGTSQTSTTEIATIV